MASYVIDNFIIIIYLKMKFTIDFTIIKRERIK